MHVSQVSECVDSRENATLCSLRLAVTSPVAAKLQPRVVVPTVISNQACLSTGNRTDEPSLPITALIRIAFRELTESYLSV